MWPFPSTGQGSKNTRTKHGSILLAREDELLGAVALKCHKCAPDLGKEQEDAGSSFLRFPLKVGIPPEGVSRQNV